MPVQTYCDRDDIIDIIGEAALISSIDDDQDGIVSASDEAKIASSIEWAASEINRQVRHQYILTEVTSNVWLKWANAILAVHRLRTRRLNPGEFSSDQDTQDIKRILNEVRWGREQLPEQSPSRDHLPSVSNIKAQPGRGIMPARVDEEESTTSRPEGNRKRHTTDQQGYGYGTGY